jgi:TldD protein
VRACPARRPPSPIPTTSAWRRCRAAAGTTRAIAAAGAQRLAPLLRDGKAAAALYAPANDPIASLDDAAKVKLLERLEAMARAADPRVREVMAHIAGTWEVVLVARSDGRMAADVRPLVRVSITVIMQDDKRHRTAASRVPPAAADASTTPTSATPCCRTMPARRASGQRQPRRQARAGRRDDRGAGPGWPGILLHEAVGHGLEGDFNRKGSSTFAGRIGQRVAAKGVTVVDDGTLPTAAAR